MEFLTITKEEYENYTINSKLLTYLNNPIRDEVNKSKNREVLYYGVKENKKVIAVARILAYNSKLGKTFYIIRGPLMDYNNFELVDFFFNNLKVILKKEKGLFIKIDPALVYKERNIEGEIVPDGIDNSQVVDHLKKLGFKHQGFYKNFDLSKLNRFEFKIDIKNKTKEQILKEMKQQHKSRINRAEKYCVEVKELKKDELGLLHDILEAASKRRHYENTPLEALKRQSEVLGDKAKFLVAYLNVKKYEAFLNEELEINEKKYNKELEKKANENTLKQIENYLISTRKRIEKLDELKEKGDLIPISCATFEMYGKMINCIHSGSFDEYMDYCGPYAIRWYMFKWGIENGYEIFNMQGITGYFERSDPNYGIYEFKKGFNGYVDEYIGEFHLPLSWKYYLRELIQKLKKKR